MNRSVPPWASPRSRGSKPWLGGAGVQCRRHVQVPELGGRLNGLRDAIIDLSLAWTRDSDPAASP